MAIIKSNGTGGGEFNLTGTWVGGIVPILGDVAVIQANDIVVIGGINIISSGISEQDKQDLATAILDYVIV